MTFVPKSSRYQSVWKFPKAIAKLALLPFVLETSVRRRRKSARTRGTLITNGPVEFAGEGNDTFIGSLVISGGFTACLKRQGFKQ